MKRREFITLLGSAAGALPLALRAEQKAMPVVGYLSSRSRPSNLGDFTHGPVHQGLAETGFVEGQNMMSEYRFAEDHYDRLPALAADLVGRKVDLIFTDAGTPPTLAAKNATSTIPIVFVDVGDPVGIGLVASLARPGGNVTGFTNISTELMPKLVELLTELAPQTKVIALLVNSNNANAEGIIRNTQEAACAKRGAPCPEGRDRSRDRHGFHLPRPAPSRGARHRPRRVFDQPARTNRSAGIASRRSDGLCKPPSGRGWRPDQLWN